MNVLDRIKTMTDDELLNALVECEPLMLVFVKQEWNKRHPEDQIPIGNYDK
jgi:hypothetical protein